MRQEVTFNLRTLFPELESICYLFNKMMISGQGNSAKLFLRKADDGTEFITIEIYRGRKYPSITVNRDVEDVDFEIEGLVSEIQFSKSILFFETDYSGSFITVYICESYNDLPDNKCKLYSFPSVSYGNSFSLFDFKLNLRKPFDELEAFSCIINAMLITGVRSHISISSDNHFSISFMFNDLDRPSLSLQLWLEKGSFPKKNIYMLSKYNICCSRDMPIFSSLSVIPKSDERHGQSLVIHVYEPIEQKLLDELNKQFALFSI